MQTLTQILMTGVLQGLIYALIGLGLYLIFSVMRVVNFAHGFFVLLGMYGLLWVGPTSLPGFLAATVVVVAVAGAFGYVVERVLIESTLHKPGHAQLVITISLGLAMQYFFQIMFPEPYQKIANPWPFDAIQVLGVTVGSGRLAAGVISLLLALGVSFLVYKTRFGSLMRACSQSLEGAVHVGINYTRVYRATFALGAAIAAIAGALLIPFQPVSPHLGLELTIKAFIVVVVGGSESMWGVLSAGILLGIAEAAGSILVSGSLATSAIYLLFLAVILVRPQGLVMRRKVSSS
ncbi:branched-chain amino acid ABC transporter permease [Aeromicrobium tamlense]|uniref:Branched-chain amino acid ABC transporter permease n=1 Tax=Aeromicrobium tamlense TaxID=375541 RepID=A0A8I0KHC9_9ACTN|nr:MULTISPECIES: branched-chain amino acid ABC transporter permease [Aeromicrobium]MBD1268612.1 branched-chain amino acid ABC transporter permease [Aeromicrobium tamlense]NYI37481.1 branched-chain amino acid transport system permease protein [Aeromicrobium tamlense]